MQLMNSLPSGNPEGFGKVHALFCYHRTTFSLSVRFSRRFTTLPQISAYHYTTCSSSSLQA